MLELFNVVYGKGELGHVGGNFAIELWYKNAFHVLGIYVDVLVTVTDQGEHFAELRNGMSGSGPALTVEVVCKAFKFKESLCHLLIVMG